MAKPLADRDEVRTLARLIDPVAASAAVTPMPQDRPPFSRAPLPMHRPMAAVAGARGLIKRECVLTTPTDDALTRLTDLIRRSTGARVNASHAVRSLLNALTDVWPRLEDELRTIGPLRLPSNARGNERAREELEQILACAVARAMRSSLTERR